MKREFITSILPDIDKEVLDKIMDEHGRDIEAQKNTITTLTTERDGLKTQLDDAESAIKSYKDMDIDGIKANAENWETKYNTETKVLQDKLEAASVVSSLAGVIVEPSEMAAWSVAHGFRIDGVGTANELFPIITNECQNKPLDTYTKLNKC